MADEKTHLASIAALCGLERNIFEYLYIHYTGEMRRFVGIVMLFNMELV